MVLFGELGFIRSFCFISNSIASTRNLNQHPCRGMKDKSLCPIEKTQTDYVSVKEVNKRTYKQKDMGRKRYFATTDAVQ